jgi:uncharacterized protein YndB with AHSA1/START domain
MADDSVSATRSIHAPAEAVFAVLADPTRHAAIDGTGWVCETVDSKPLTASGQIFRMSMYHADHPDGSYQTATGSKCSTPRAPSPGRQGTTPATAPCASAAGLGATTSRQLDPRTPQFRLPTTGQQPRTPLDSSLDFRRSLRTIWATRSPISPN